MPLCLQEIPFPGHHSCQWYTHTHTHTHTLWWEVWGRGDGREWIILILAPWWRRPFSHTSEDT
jgi:hypothetical protein